MKRKIIIYAVVIISILLIGEYWYHQQHKQRAITSFKQQPIVVTTAKAIRAYIPNEVNAIGNLLAIRQVNVSPELSGELTAIRYQPGTLVKKGDVLFQLDNRIYQANLKSAEAAFILAKQNLRRYQPLVRMHAISKQMLDQAQATYLEAQSTVKSDQAYLSETTIKAPFSGYIGAKNFSVGDYVTSGQQLTTLTDRNVLQVEYQLSENYLSKVKLGQRVRITTQEYPAKTFHGVVSYVSPIVDVATHSFTVEANVANIDNELAPGLFVKVIQMFGQNQPTLLVPQQSILPTITGAKIFTVVKGHAKSVKVETGMTINNNVEIVKGLKQGEVVVTAGQELLKNGSPVKEVKST